jgi:hypothetical protein
MVHSSDSPAPSPGEGFAYDAHEDDLDTDDHEDDLDTDDHEDDLDTDADEEPQAAVAGTWIRLSREEGDCMVLFCSSGTDVWRACGTKGCCHRIVPSPHKHMAETTTTHASNGWFQALAPTRKDSQVLDGLVSSYRSEEDHQADMQRRTDENQVMARRLAEASPDNGRSFRYEDDSDEVDETPVRTNRATRFAQPPARTHGRVSGSGTGSLAGSADRLPGRNGPMLTPARTAAETTATLDSLTLLVQASLRGQAVLQEEARASQVIMDNLLAQMAFRDQVATAMSTSPSLAPVVTTIDDDSDSSSEEELGPKAKSRNGAKHGDRKKRGKKGRRDKAPSTWYGVAAGQYGSVRSTLSNAKNYAKSFDPSGKVSSKFDTKAEAEAWVALHIDVRNSSDTASVGADTNDSAFDTDVDAKPRARRGGLIPPGRLPTSTEPLFDLVSQDPSVGKKNELFGIVIRKELEVLKALAPKNTVEDTQRVLSECIVDGTMLPGTSSERFDNEEGVDNGDSMGRVAATLSRVIREVKGRSIGGISQVVDEGFQNPSRVSLRSVKNLEQLHTLEQELGQAIPSETENMRLAFGAALHHLGWTDAQEDTYLLGGHFPYISIMVMRYYSDLVRELARRSVHGWARVKIDITYFVKRLQSIRSNGNTRFLVMVRTYIFLRDQRHANFESIDRMSSQVNALYARLESSGNPQPETEGTSVSMCQKCKQKSLHKGGRRSCPFKDLDDGPARSAGTLAAKLCLEGSTKTEAYQKAKLRFEEDD